VAAQVVRKNIAEAIAVKELIQLIKDNDRWVEPEPEEAEEAEEAAVVA
jgi:hypothetical protein